MMWLGVESNHLAPASDGAMIWLGSVVQVKGLDC